MCINIASVVGFYFLVLIYMKKTTIFIIGAGALVLLYFMRKASAGKKIKASLFNLRTKSRGGLIPDIFIDFKLINPSNEILSISSITGDLLLNDNQLATVSNLNNITVQPMSERIYPVKLELTGLSVVQTVYSLIKNKGAGLKVAFNGAVNSMGFDIPINQSIVLKK